MLHQFPSSFEFNEDYLLAIHDHVYSHRFGTFLFNCQQERETNRLREKTVSLWTFLLHPVIRPKWYNPSYIHPQHVERWTQGDVKQAKERHETMLAQARREAAIQAAAATSTGRDGAKSILSDATSVFGSPPISPLTSSPSATVIASFFCIPSVSSKRIILWERLHLRHDPEYVRTNIQTQQAIGQRILQEHATKMLELEMTTTTTMINKVMTTSSSSIHDDDTATNTNVVSESIDSAWMTRYNLLMSKLLDAGMDVEKLELGIVEEEQKLKFKQMIMKDTDESTSNTSTSTSGATKTTTTPSKLPTSSTSTKLMTPSKPLPTNDAVAIVSTSTPTPQPTSPTAVSYVASLPSTILVPPSTSSTFAGTSSRSSPSPPRTSISRSQLVTLKASIDSSTLTHARKSLKGSSIPGSNAIILPTTTTIPTALKPMPKRPPPSTPTSHNQTTPPPTTTTPTPTSNESQATSFSPKHIVIGAPMHMSYASESDSDGDD